MKRLAGIVGVAAVAVGVAGPASAHHSPPKSPPYAIAPHKCQPHNVAYVTSGTYVTSSLTKNADGTYSGSITVIVTRTNHHAKGVKHTQVVYTLTKAHVTFGHGVTTPPAVGSKVQLIGKITALAKMCNQTGFTPKITIRKVVIHVAHSHD
jgi:hypothetical protein